MIEEVAAVAAAVAVPEEVAAVAAAESPYTVFMGLLACSKSHKNQWHMGRASEVREYSAAMLAHLASIRRLY